MIEAFLLVVDLLPAFAREHGPTMGVAGGSAIVGWTGAYVYLSGRIDRTEALMTERFDAMGQHLKNLVRQSAERDAHLEGQVDAVAREARDGRNALHARLDEINTRLSRLEGRMNGRS